MTPDDMQRYYPRMRRWKSTKRGLVSLALLGMVALPACAERHEGKGKERAEIVTLEQRWRQAQLADDVPAMDKLLSDEFLGITANGQVVTKLQQLDRMRNGSLDIKRLELSDTKIKISGGLAVVTSLANLDGVADGTPLHGAFRYTRVYQHVPGDGWRITNFEITHVGHPGAQAPAAESQVHSGAAASSHLTSLARFVSRLPRS